MKHHHPLEYAEIIEKERKAVDGNESVNRDDAEAPA